MNILETRNAVTRAAEQYYEDNAFFATDHSITDKVIEMSKSTVVPIMVDVYCMKHGIGSVGGGFVQAIVENKLEETFARVDSFNLPFIKLYVMCASNMYVNVVA